MRVGPRHTQPVHDSTFGVARRMHPASLTPVDLLAQTRESRTRRSGPGGQHRNKVETAVILVHLPTGISAEASERRSLAENRRVALQRLRLRLALQHRSPAAYDGPSALWRSRLRGRLLAVAGDHDDYPTLIAEALDRLQAVGFDMSRAATTLLVSPTQLAGLFRKQRAAWTALAALRARIGLPALK